MVSIKSLFCLSLTLILLSACANNKKVDTASTNAGKSVADNATTSGYGYGSGIDEAEIQNMRSEGILMEESMMASNATLKGGLFADTNSPLSKQTIYFAFDSSQMRAEFNEVLVAHAKYLAENAEQQIILEGHTDEIGSPEYNVALSEQRAKSVAQTLVLKGVLESQIALISYGEEKPVAFAHNESSWRLNRRVELIYQTK